MKNLLLPFLVLTGIIITSCKKYPDGNLISVWPRKERIEGKWVAESVKYNSNDSTVLFKDHIWEFTRNSSVILQIQNVKITGIWNTQTNDKDFQITYDNGAVEQYEIRKLTLKEFWLRNKATQVDFHLKSK